jgi:hypothetical protein
MKKHKHLTWIITNPDPITSRKTNQQLHQKKSTVTAKGESENYCHRALRVEL